MPARVSGSAAGEDVVGFLAPWFLAGLAAVGLPIWLHLLNQHKTTPLPFSPLMFFARPCVNSATVASSGGGKLLVVAIDNSFSMRQGDRLDRAKSEAVASLSS